MAGYPPKDTAAAQLAKILEADSKKARMQLKLKTRVVECIEDVPMNKGMNWAEYSKRCYERFGRHKAYGCACGNNLYGASGLCRMCGRPAPRTKKQGAQDQMQVTWSEDLYELCSPLLDPDVKLNHSEQQYALRAVTQRLHKSQFDWKGPERPLKMAVDAGCADLVFVMLQAGMDANEPDKLGITALHDAVYNGRLDICKILLDGRAKVNNTDRHGQTPLFFSGTVEICGLLLEAEADVTLVSEKDQSALHLVGRAGLRDVFEHLSKRCNHATKELRDSHGATAVNYLNITSPEAAGDDGSRDTHGSKAKYQGRSKAERRWKTRHEGKRRERGDQSGSDSAFTDESDVPSSPSVPNAGGNSVRSPANAGGSPGRSAPNSAQSGNVVSIGAIRPNSGRR